MLLFLDTEYTDPTQLRPKLISIGLVAEDGRREFYVELSDTWQVAECTRFVRGEVLPLLSGPHRAEGEARVELRRWLAESPRRVQVACDSETDMALLLSLIGLPRPQNLAETYFDLRPLIDTTVYDSTVEQYYREDPRRHHALVDARAYRLAWLAWMDYRKSKRR